MLALPASAPVGFLSPHAARRLPTTYLLNHVVQVLGNLGGQAVGLQDAQNFGAGDGADLRGRREAGPRDTQWVNETQACT